MVNRDGILDDTHIIDDNNTATKLFIKQWIN